MLGEKNKPQGARSGGTVDVTAIRSAVYAIRPRRFWISQMVHCHNETMLFFLANEAASLSISYRFDLITVVPHNRVTLLQIID